MRSYCCTHGNSSKSIFGAPKQSYQAQGPAASACIERDRSSPLAQTSAARCRAWSSGTRWSDCAAAGTWTEAVTLGLQLEVRMRMHAEQVLHQTCGSVQTNPSTEVCSLAQLTQLYSAHSAFPLSPKQSYLKSVTQKQDVRAGSPLPGGGSCR